MLAVPLCAATVDPNGYVYSYFSGGFGSPPCSSSGDLSRELSVTCTGDASLYRPAYASVTVSPYSVAFHGYGGIYENAVDSWQIVVEGYGQTSGYINIEGGTGAAFLDFDTLAGGYNHTLGYMHVGSGFYGLSGSGGVLPPPHVHMEATYGVPIPYSIELGTGTKDWAPLEAQFGFTNVAITAATPEPGYLLVVGGGLLAIFLVAGRATACNRGPRFPSDERRNRSW
jgi:hypothetical protein